MSLRKYLLSTATRQGGLARCDDGRDHSGGGAACLPEVSILPSSSFRNSKSVKVRVRF